ncbi:MAG: hypothetical protein IT180_17210 [Acidobacteria bacterium]|nr:hypothetical protein [Acidobacteriota bacterium]
MRHALALFVLVLAPTLSAQQKATSSRCSWLSPDEASAVIGAGVKLQMAVEDGACVYASGPVQLQIARPARLRDTRAMQMGFNSMKQDRKGQDEPGIGDSAFVAANNREIAFVKGDAFVVITVTGEGAESRLPALKDAVRKIAERF